MIRKEGLASLNVPLSFEKWRIRVQYIRNIKPGEGWPDVSDEKLLETLEEWLVPFLENVLVKKELEKIDPSFFISLLLPYELQSRLDKLLPQHILVPSGSEIPIVYHADGSIPELHVRMQEIFGMKTSPTVNEGRQKLKLFLLSPAKRPVQITQDLEGFWKNHWPEVRKELKIKYPRHSWPEDPFTAQAIRGALKKKSNSPLVSISLTSPHFEIRSTIIGMIFGFL